MPQNNPRLARRLECPGTDGDAWVVCTHKDDGKRRTVAHVYDESRATLFAAAPELLTALESLLSELGNCLTLPQGAFGRSVYLSQSAIAKAKGQS